MIIQSSLDEFTQKLNKLIFSYIQCSENKN